MNVHETNEIRELAADEINIVSGGYADLECGDEGDNVLSSVIWAAVSGAGAGVVHAVAAGAAAGVVGPRR